MEFLMIARVEPPQSSSEYNQYNYDMGADRRWPGHVFMLTKKGLPDKEREAAEQALDEKRALLRRIGVKSKLVTIEGRDGFEFDLSTRTARRGFELTMQLDLAHWKFAPELGPPIDERNIGG
jgi:hypothetical protein